MVFGVRQKHNEKIYGELRCGDIMTVAIYKYCDADDIVYRVKRLSDGKVSGGKSYLLQQILEIIWMTFLNLSYLHCSSFPGRWSRTSLAKVNMILLYAPKIPPHTASYHYNIPNSHVKK